jgi:hypothetical protein
MAGVLFQSVTFMAPGAAVATVRLELQGHVADLRYGQVFD